MARRRVVRLPDLFRLFGLFRYCDRLGLSPRNSAAEKFRDALPGLQYSAILAAMAYYLHAILARLCISAACRYAPGRPTLPRCTTPRCDRRDDGVVRPVARRWMEFHCLGHIAWHCHRVRNGMGEISWLACGGNRMGGGLRVFRGHIGFLPLAQSAVCVRLSRHHAVVPRRATPRSG